MRPGLGDGAKGSEDPCSRPAPKLPSTNFDGRDRGPRRTDARGQVDRRTPRAAAPFGSGRSPPEASTRSSHRLHARRSRRGQIACGPRGPDLVRERGEVVRAPDRQLPVVTLEVRSDSPFANRGQTRDDPETQQRVGEVVCEATALGCRTDGSAIDLGPSVALEVSGEQVTKARSPRFGHHAGRCFARLSSHIGPAGTPKRCGNRCQAHRDHAQRHVSRPRRRGRARARSTPDQA